MTSFTALFTRHPIILLVSLAVGCLVGGSHHSSPSLTFGPPVIAGQVRPGLVSFLHLLLCTTLLRPSVSISGCVMEQARKRVTSKVLTPLTSTLESINLCLVCSAVCSILRLGLGFFASMLPIINFVALWKGPHCAFRAIMTQLACFQTFPCMELTKT